MNERHERELEQANIKFKRLCDHVESEAKKRHESVNESPECPTNALDEEKRHRRQLEGGIEGLRQPTVLVNSPDRRSGCPGKL